MAVLNQIELPNGTTYDIQDNQPAVLNIPNTPASIATFSGASNLPLSSLKVTVTPYQDLHGYDAPWAGGAGKNKCDTHGYDGIAYNRDVGTEVTFTDSTIPVTVNGNKITYSVASWGGVVFKTPSLPSGTYHFHAEFSSTVNRRTIYVLNSNNVVKEAANYSDSGGILDLNRTLEDGDCIAIWIGSNSAGDITITNIQVESGSSYTTWQPYSNICPIIGWDEAVVTVADDAESPTTSHEYTIDLDGTRYGGTLDVVSGVLTVDRAMVDLGDLNWTYANGFFRTLDLNSTIKRPANNYAIVNAISSMYKAESWNAISGTSNGKFAVSTGTSDPLIVCNTDYTDATAFKTAMNGVQLVYELATPITVQLTPTQVKSLEGENNISANCGQITEVKYVVSKYNGMTAKISEFAEKANQLTTDAGSKLNPVYFNNGVPVASIGNSIPFVVGTGTTAGTWLGAIEGLTEYYDGLLFLYKSPVAGASTTTLNLNNLGAKTVYLNSSSKLTTHYPANQPILLTYSTSTNSGCFVAVDNYDSNSNTIGEYAGACKAGTNGMARYSLIMQTKQSGNDETWESLVTTSSTATSKTKNSSGFIVGSPVLYQSAGTYAKDGVAGTSGCWSTAYNVDTRYSCNVSSSWSAEGRPFFIKGTINTLDGLFYLANTTWWSDAYPTSADGFYYIYVGQMSDTFRFSLYPEHPIFYYDGGLKVFIPGVAEKADAEDVVGNIFVDSTMNIAVTPGTNTPKSVSLSVPGLVNKADKSTTLSGYNIGDAYISNGSITLGNNSITPLTSTSTLNAAKLSGTIPSSCYTDTNDAVLQSPISTNNNFEVLFSHSANNTAETSSIGKDNGFLYNPSTNALTITGNYSDTNGLLAMKEVTQAQYDALTTAEKNNGTAYFITDRLSPAATDLWTKVGTATLTTTAQDCSAAINELNTEIIDTHNTTELLDVSGINAMTTATSKDLSDEFTNYEYLVIQLRAYNNVYQTTFVTSSYFNGTGSGTRPILMGFNTSGTYLGAVEVYKNTTSKVYIKTSSGNTFGASHRIYIIGIMKKL